MGFLQFDYKDRGKNRIHCFLFLDSFPKFAIFHSYLPLCFPEFAIMELKIADFIVISII